MGEEADSRAPLSRVPTAETRATAPPGWAPLRDVSRPSTRPTRAPRRREGVYRELDHPADLLLEITGPDLATLFENALFAFYDQVAELGGFGADREVVIAVSETSPPDLLRALLTEALYRFETEGFVAVDAQVTIESMALPESAAQQAAEVDSDRRGMEPEPGAMESGPVAMESGPGDIAAMARGVKAEAHLWGENATRDRHILATEIKAVTYHRLAVERTPDGAYRATVLFDV